MPYRSGTGLPGWHLRDLTDDDLEAAVSLDSVSSCVDQQAPFPLSEVVASLVAGRSAPRLPGS